MIKRLKKATLAAAALIFLGQSAAEAAVLLTFRQDGMDVTATWSGTYRTPSGTGLDLGPGGSIASFGAGPGIATEAVSFGFGSVEMFIGAGSLITGVVPASGRSLPLYSGETFGFSNSALFIDEAAPENSTYFVGGVMTFLNTTLATLQVQNYNNTLVYTGNGSVNGDREIRFTTLTTVPEPTSLLSVVLAGAGLLSRRRRAV